MLRAELDQSGGFNQLAVLLQQNNALLARSDSGAAARLGSARHIAELGAF